MLACFNPWGYSMRWRPIIDISWSDRKLEKICATDSRGQRKFGAEGWRLLKRRLIALEAAPTLADMDGVPGRCHQLTADRAETFAVDLGRSYRLIFAPDQNPVPRLPDGGIDARRIIRIRITEVADYHGR